MSDGEKSHLVTEKPEGFHVEWQIDGRRYMKHFSYSRHYEAQRYREAVSIMLKANRNC